MWIKIVSNMTQHGTNQTKGSNTTRRTVLKAGLAASAAAVGVSASGIGMAQSEMDLSLDADAEAELVTITNNGDSEVDLTGYQMNFEAGPDSEVNQTRTLAGEVTIGAGESVTVATGAGESGDVSLEEPYEGEVLNNENPDVVALLSPEGDEVATTGDTSGSGDDNNEGDSETHTLTVTLMDSRNADIVSGEVTVNGETQTTEPVSDDSPEIIETEFELEDGTYTVSGEAEQFNVTLETNEQEVEIDGEDESVSLTLYPPDSDELEDGDSDENKDDDDSDGTDDTADSDDESQDDCPEEEPEPKDDDCPEEEPEPKPEEKDCEKR